MEKVMFERLKRMSQIGIDSVVRSELVDIDTVKINSRLPVKERLEDYIRQIKNPYCYLSHGVVVKISFTNQRRLEECLASCVAMEA